MSSPWYNHKNYTLNYTLVRRLYRKSLSSVLLHIFSAMNYIAGSVISYFKTEM